MTEATKLRLGVEERLHMLHATPDADGSDVGIFDAVIKKAKETVLSVSGFEELPECLIGAVCDLAAADYAEYIFTSDSGIGSISSKSDGEFSVRYRDGTSREERLFALTDRLRENGTRAANTSRRLRW